MSLSEKSVTYAPALPLKISETLQTRLLANAALKILFSRAQSIVPVDAGHDFSHTLRVAEGAARIYLEELNSIGREVSAQELDDCFASAFLHDAVPVPKNSPLRKESSRLSSEKAGIWLSELNWPAQSRNEIQQAILDHSFSSGRTPNSLLGQALQDADRLEALGALGLYRTIATGVSMGADLFDANDPWAENRALDDKKFSIDHFFTKLLGLHETFRTPSAKALAKQRTEFLEQFLNQLKRELNP